MKKRILSLLLCLVLCLSLMPIAAFATEPTKYNDGGGDGSQATPWLIKNLDQLNDLADAVNGEGTYAGSASNMSGKYFKLTADIGSETDRFIKVIGKKPGYNDTPHFAGNFDGGGHYVWLNIAVAEDSISDMYYGMFGLRGATISNLTVKGTVSANNTHSSENDDGPKVYAGGIAGWASSSDIINCRSECTVTAQKAGITCRIYAGGICGLLYNNDTVVNCSSSGSVTATGGKFRYAGGIAGCNSNGGLPNGGSKIKNSFSDAVVATNNGCAGGIAGYNSGSDSIIANCYYSGTTVSGGTNTTGGVCGCVSQNAQFKNCYYDSTVLTGKKAVGGTADTDKVKGLPTTDMQAAAGTSGALVDLLNGYKKSPENTYPIEFKKWTVSSNSYPLFEGMTPPEPPVTPPVTPTSYPIYVNNERFTSEHLTINCGSGTATLDATTTPYTLTLDDATITATLQESFGNAAVYTDTDLNVVLEGENTITVNQSSDSGFYARNAALTLEGEGSLTVSAKDSGIYMSGTAAKTVTLGGSGKLEITGESAGIYSKKGVTVVFSNTNSTPVSIVASDQYGIWSVNGDITLSGTGDANIHALNTAVYVFDTVDTVDTGDVTFSGSGNIALEGGHEVNSTANGIYVQNGDVKFTGNGGQVSVKGDGDAIYLGTSDKKVVLSGSASPIALSAGDGYCAVRNAVDTSGLVTDTNAAYNVTGAPNTPSAVYTLKIPTYTVTVQNDGNGTASANKTSAVKGETVTLTATPSTGYHFKEWQSSDVTVNGNSFTMPEKNVTVRAIFEANALTGTVSITGSAKYGEALTADITGTNNTGTLSYQWKRGGAEISGATNSTYTLTADDIGKTVTVSVSSSVETGTITSAATSAIEKADGPAAPTGLAGTACTTSANNDGKITGTTSAMEYSTVSTFASKTACTGTEITGLANGTYYVRIAETATHKAGAAATVVVDAYISDSYTVTFNPNGGSVTPTSATTGAGGKLTSLPKPTRWGYTFDGWYTAATGGTKVTVTNVYTADTTIYAHWVRNQPVTPPAPFTPVTPTKPELPFTDVNKADWSYEDIYYAWENGLMNGTSGTTFSPKVTTSRGMIVTILYRLEGEPVVSGVCPFTDVKSGSYFEKAITWAAANKIVGGYGNGKFGPDDPITREQMAAILYRYAEFKGYDVSARAGLSKFSDFNKVDAWATESVTWANAVGLVNGVNDTELDPLGLAKREQIAAILHLFCENLVK